MAGEGLFCWAPLLWKLIRPYPVGIVVHSSWRDHYRLTELRGLFPRSMRPAIVGVTEGPGRCEGILNYVERYGIVRYLVLDDMPEAFPPNWEHLVVCDEALGISAHAVQKRIQTFLQQL